MRKPKFKEGKKPTLGLKKLLGKKEEWKPFDDGSMAGSHFDTREEAEAKAMELSKEDTDQVFIAVPCKDKDFRGTYEILCRKYHKSLIR